MLAIISLSMSILQKNHCGFTIVELLVTLVVGATFVLAINTVFTTQVYISQRGRDLVLANAYAEGKFEALRSQGFLGLSDGTTSVTSELPIELNSPRSGSLQISTLNSATKKAVLTITYNEQGKTRTYSYTSYIGELGVGQY
jgi:prepilin-type N-terminal cleavage/methylation domain-containing protein